MQRSPLTCLLFCNCPYRLSQFHFRMSRRTMCRASMASCPRDVPSGSRRQAAPSLRRHRITPFCSIGVHTHHMADPAPSHQSELADALRAMSGLDYVRAEEVAAIPVITREIKYVVYGPLAQFPLDPHVILLFAHAQQGLIISEAVARVRQGGAAGDGTARLRGDSAGVKWWQFSDESWLLRRARLSRCVVRRHRHVGVSRKQARGILCGDRYPRAR